jgi:hypothetical protein
VAETPHKVGGQQMPKGEVNFRGEAPFLLPPVKSAKAHAVNNTVVLTFVVPAAGARPEPVEIELSVRVALSLGQQILAAGGQAQKNAREADRKS